MDINAKTPKLLALIISALLFLVVLVQNSQIVEFHILFWTIRMSLIILIFLFMLIGAALSSGSYYLFRVKRRKKQSSVSPQTGLNRGAPTPQSPPQ